MSVPSLIRAVAQAKTWYDWITKGDVRTIRELAKRTGFNENCVSRILDLAVLSPEITDAIFRGDHDPSLTVAQLIANLEIDWTRQKLSTEELRGGLNDNMPRPHFSDWDDYLG